MMSRSLAMALILVSSLVVGGTAGTALAAEEDADIEVEAIDVEEDDPSQGEAISITARIDNSEWNRQRFFVGLTVEGPGGDRYDNQGETGKVVSFRGWQEEEVELSFEIPDDAPEGEYDVIIATWAETNRHGLDTQLDREVDYGVFRVEKEADADSDWGTDDDGSVTTVESADHSGDTREDWSDEQSEFESKQATVALIDVGEKSYTEMADIPADIVVNNELDEPNDYVVKLQVRGPDQEWRSAVTEHVSLDEDEGQHVRLYWNYKYDAPSGRYDVRAVVEETNFFGGGEDAIAKSSVTRNAFFLVTYDTSEECREAISTWSNVQNSKLPAVLFNHAPTAQIRHNCYR